MLDRVLLCRVLKQAELLLPKRFAAHHLSADHQRYVELQLVIGDRTGLECEKLVDPGARELIEFSKQDFDDERWCLALVDVVGVEAIEIIGRV